MKKTNQSGFSLVELMVVVAIIGILSAVAIPQYQKFQAKSRQSEAKTNLGGLFTAQSAYMAEWNQYFGDWRDIGMEVRGDLYYGVGSNIEATINSPVQVEYNGPVGANAAAAQFNSTLWIAGAGLGLARERAGLAVTPTNGAATVTALNAFQAHAEGNIDNDVFIDQWGIDSTKSLRNCIPVPAAGAACTAAQLAASNDVDN